MATPRLRSKKLSEPTIARLPVYQRIAEGWYQRGVSKIDSKQIGELAGVTATTVRLSPKPAAGCAAVAFLMFRLALRPGGRRR